MASVDGVVRSWVIAGGVLAAGMGFSACSAGSARDERDADDGSATPPRAVTSLTDCGENGGAERAGAKCAAPLCETAGSIGAGPRIGCSASGVESGDGFIDIENRRLVVSVSSDDTGGIWGIDLDDGSRELLAGSATDPALGIQTEGEGVDLTGVDNVQPFAGGWIAHAGDRLVAIDPESGVRRLVLEGNSHTCTGSSEPVYVSLGIFAVAGDGTIYFPASRGNSNEAGIVRMTPDFRACNVVAYWETFEKTIVGTGPFDLEVPRALVARDNQLWWVDFGSLIALDLGGGSWRRVSSGSSAGAVGSGDADIGDSSVAWHEDEVWTLGPFGITRVDPITGDRDGFTFDSGPVYYTSASAFWPLPESELLLLGGGGAFVLYEPGTRNSNLFSW